MKPNFSLAQFFAILLLLALCHTPPALSQVPQGFNYQAVARDGITGNPITDPVSVKIAILSDDDPEDVVWEELHENVDPDEHGLFSIIIGSGVWESGVPSFSDIDWTVLPKYIRTKIYYGGGWKEMGSAPVMSVPYALVADSLGGPLKKLSVIGETEDMEEALFEVRNMDGNIVFAVYNEGVRAYVEDGDIKGVKGGFAIGGIGAGKQGDQHYLFVSGDSIRAYIDSTSVKGVKGGFAIGGFDYTKGKSQDYMKVTRDSVRIYLDANPATKGVKGGFAIGGFDYTKGDQNFFNVSMDTLGKIDPSENRILWYPLKNAFRTGKVLIEKRDSVGENSFASGFESKAIGKYSQALGYQAIARKDYSTAIGYQAVANKINSFAFGQWALAKNEESYAFGRGAIAEGFRSFAFGSAGVDSAGVVTGVAYANGDYSFAIGQGSGSKGIGSFAFGLADTATGSFSSAIGYKNSSPGFGSIAIGYEAFASGEKSVSIGSSLEWMNPINFTGGLERVNSSGYRSVAIGHAIEASGAFSIAMGSGYQWAGVLSKPIETITYGKYSVAIGTGLLSTSFQMTALGSFNIDLGGSTTSWITTDPLFVIGNGYYSHGSAVRRNALTVLKNGNVGIGINAPVSKLDVNGRARFYNGGDTPGILLTNAANTTDEVFVGMYDDNNFGILDIGTAWRMIFNNTTGNIGIGTTSPLNRLSVVGTRSSTINSANAIASIGGADVFTYFGALDGPPWNTWIQPFRPSDNAPFGLSLCPVGGNVGIGTSSPSVKLEVVSNVNGYVMSIKNEGDNYTRHGVRIQGGPNSAVASTTNLIGFADGDGTGVGSIYLNNGILYYASASDSLLKTNIETSNIKGVEIIGDIRVVNYELKKSPGRKHTGFIAQELQEILPDAVSLAPDNYLHVSQQTLIPVLTKAIQEQQQQIESQQQQIDELKAIVEKLMVK